MDNYSQNENILKDLHKDLEILFQKITGKSYLGFSSALKEIEGRSHEKNIFQRIAKEGALLYDLNNIRNVLTHGKYCILIPDKTIKEIKILRDSLTQKAKDLFSVDVFSCIDTETLSDVLREMELKQYTHVPVYSSLDKSFVGVLSENDITFWLMNKLQDDDILIEKDNLRVKDIMRDKKDYKDCIFERADTPIFEIELRFDNFIKENKRLGAIFLTNLGKDNEKIEGVVTAWDLPKIANSIYE